MDRSKMGQLEPGSFHLHPVFIMWMGGRAAPNHGQVLRNTPGNGYSYQPGQIGGSGCLDGRAAAKRSELGKCPGQQVR